MHLWHRERSPRESNRHSSRVAVQPSPVADSCRFLRVLREHGSRSSRPAPAPVRRDSPLHLWQEYRSHILSGTHAFENGRRSSIGNNRDLSCLSHNARSLNFRGHSAATPAIRLFGVVDQFGSNRIHLTHELSIFFGGMCSEKAVHIR